LPISTRRKFESSFGHDFAEVRVHTDKAASLSAAGLSSNAYSVGSDIVFGEGRYQPGSQEGDRLLAHELTHVVQQNQFGQGDPARVSDHNDRSEEEARSMAQNALRNEAVHVEAMPSAGLSRDDDDPKTVSPFKNGPLAPLNLGLLNGSPPGVSLGYGAPLSPIIPDAPSPYGPRPTPDPTPSGGGGGGDSGPTLPWGVGIQAQGGDQQSIGAGLTVHF
jgi:hypothetical protein